MMKMNRAVMWMLTSGKYSDDYRVHGIYTDKAEANAAARVANFERRDYDDTYCIEEVDVLDGANPCRVPLVNITGRPLKGGEPKEHRRGAGVMAGRQDAIRYVNYNELTGILRVFGETKAARKAYAEHAARIKADAEGITR